MPVVSLKPTAGYILIKPLEAEKKTASGIYLPETNTEKPQKGKVISISEVDEKGNKPAVKVGDNVLYGKYSGTEIQIEGKDYLIMREADIFAVV